MIRTLEKLGVRVHCWGGGWPAGRVSQEDMLKIFSQSKINLNFSKSAGVWWKELASLFLSRDYERKIKPVNPRYWIDNLKCLPPCIWGKQLKARNFEIPGCGGFCLTEYVEGLEHYYEIGKEIECFSTPEDAAEKIQYYLGHEKERERIAQAGFQRATRDHTWEKILKNIFEVIGSGKTI
jgi:spore maturation protein CgeB